MNLENYLVTSREKPNIQVSVIETSVPSITFNNPIFPNLLRIDVAIRA